MRHTDSWDTCRRMLADERCISTWRRVAARRAARPKRKSFNPKVSPPRFTDDQARQIWREVAALNGKQQKIVAERWGINIAAVSKIWNGLHYKGATEELREAWKRHGCIGRIKEHG